MRNKSAISNFTLVLVRFVIFALIALSMLGPVRAENCKEDPVEAMHCVVQKPDEAIAQDTAVNKWETKARTLYGEAWSSWENSKGRVRCHMEGNETCCHAGAVPCKP